MHEYDDVNLNIIWDVVHSEIPSLIKRLQLQVPPDTKNK
ncbi:MAG: HepT-like ribonuclease domain-containing protein [Cyanobacteriota bacterium]